MHSQASGQFFVSIRQDDYGGAISVMLMDMKLFEDVLY